VLSYDSLYHAPTDKMTANVAEWTEMIGKLTRTKGEFADRVAAPLTSSSWSGDAAKLSTGFIAETGKEFDDAIKEATGIRDILSETLARISAQKAELHMIAETDAPAADCQVKNDGTVVAASWTDFLSNTPLGDKVPGAEELEKKIKELQLRVDRALVNASEADRTAAEALRTNLGGQQHNFSAPTHTNLGQAWLAHSQGNFTGAQSFIFDEMMRNKDSATVAKIRELLASGNAVDRAHAMALWGAKVAPNMAWDHKPILEERLGLDGQNDYYFKDPNGKRSVYYDIWSNIHYGYVGRASGFNRSDLDEGAQVPIIAGKTDPGDIYTVKVGMDLYDKYGPNITEQQFQQEVKKSLDEMERQKVDGKLKPSS
jgi:hypothetical protein